MFTVTSADFAYAGDLIASVNMDKTKYTIGDTITVTGKVAEVLDDEIFIALFDPDDDEIFVDYFPVKRDRSFKGEIILKSNYPVGEYTLEVTYLDDTRFIEFDVERKQRAVDLIAGVSINKQKYSIGDKVVVTGKVSEVVDGEVTIALFDPEDDEVFAGYFPVKKDGSFSGEIVLKNDYSVGTYTLEITYVDETRFIEFNVERKQQTGTGKTEVSGDITLTIDSSDYTKGSSVNVSGKTVANDNPISIEVLYPDNKVFIKEEVKAASDGSFKHTFALNGNIVQGKYTLNVKHMEKTASISFNVYIATLTAGVDKKTYALGEKVQVSGKASGVPNEFVLIEVLNPENKQFTIREVSPTDGTYSFTFTLNGALAVAGPYSIIVKYADQLARSSLDLAIDKVDKAHEDKTIKVSYDGNEYDVTYAIENAELVDMKVDGGKILHVMLDNSKFDGILKITIPRDLIDAKAMNKDTSFRVIINGKQSFFQEVKSDEKERVLSIPLPPGTKDVKIMGFLPAQNITNNNIPNETSTLLFLDPIPKIATSGKELTFNGVLKTAGRGPLEGVPITLNTIDALGNVQTVAASITNKDGMFTMKWTPDTAKKFNVFAAFDGEANYVKSRSPIFAIDVEQLKILQEETVLGPLSLQVESKQYNVNEFVTIHGKIENIRPARTVGLEIVNPKETPYLIAEARIDRSDNTFTYSFQIFGKNATPGLYVIRAEYWNEKDMATFMVGQPEVYRSRAIIDLNQPLPEISRGDTMVFTGNLKRENGVWMSDATVWIKYRASDGSTPALAYGKTDSNGRFTIQWVSDNVAMEENLRVYAFYEGDHGITTSISREHTIHVKETANYMSIRADKSLYAVGETIYVSGSIQPVVSNVPAVIQILNSQTSLSFGIVDIRKGTFEYKFDLKGDLGKSGRYMIKLSYMDRFVMTEVDVYQPLTPPLVIEQASVIDAIGLESHLLPSGKEVYVKATVKNNYEFIQPFTYIIKVTDSDGYTVAIRWIDREVDGRGSISVDVPWIPESQGRYTVSFFVWQGIDNPLPLSPDPLILNIPIRVT